MMANRRSKLTLPGKAGALLALLIAGLLLAGCLPKSRQPIDTIEHALNEPRLAGVWTGKFENETTYAHFLPDGAAYDVLVVSHRDDDGEHRGTWSRYRLYPTRVGAETYMNVQVVSDDGKPAGPEGEFYHFLRYTISNAGELAVWSISPEAVEKDIAKGLKGEVLKKILGDDVVIEATPAEIRAWLQGSDQQVLFKSRIALLKQINP